MNIRKAKAADIDAIEKIYDDIHTAEEKGEQTTGWIRGSLSCQCDRRGRTSARRPLCNEDGRTAARLSDDNDIQVDVYKDGKWEYEAADDEVCVRTHL